jgi:hypothetical protein
MTIRSAILLGRSRSSPSTMFRNASRWRKPAAPPCSTCRGKRRRAPERPYPRQGPGKMHRRCRHGGPCRRLGGRRLRQGQAKPNAGDRSAACRTRDDVRLPSSAASLARHASESPRPRRPAIDYHSLTGFPKTPEQMRGAARDFVVPRDMRTPEALRPFSPHL